jgi:predicted DCC family thiol-disulfide oxidoreductase YuxK
MKETGEHALILFDGVCNFCNSSVNIVLRRDKKDYFRFAPLQSPTGQEILRKNKMDPAGLESIVLVEKDKIYTRSVAALRVAKKLSGAWPLFYAFVIVPPFIRDIVYQFIAKNRYRWFGKKESCMIPTPDVRRKFVDGF